MKATAMSLPTNPKRYLISAITKRFPTYEPITVNIIPEKKEGSKHLWDEGVCDVPFQKKKREKSQDISKMKDDVIKFSPKTQESSNSVN